MLARLDEGMENPVVECFDQILMAGRNTSKLISKPHVLPPTGCRANVVRGVVGLSSKAASARSEAKCTLAGPLCSLGSHVTDLGRHKTMAPHSRTLAWKIPWAKEPGRLQSMGSLRVGHD